MRNNVFVGTGRLMPNLKTIHGRKLTAGWVGVEVVSLKVKELECWKEYPTHSDYVEEGSFSAWREEEIIVTQSERDYQTGKYTRTFFLQNLSSLGKNV